MKILLPLVTLAAVALAMPVPSGLVASISVVGIKGGTIAIATRGDVTFVVTFSNPTAAAVRFPLRTAFECEVQVTDLVGTVHPFLRLNGPWWSPSKCSSTLEPFGSERNLRVLAPGEHRQIELRLSDVLAVPAGGEPPGWPFDRKKGFAPGSYRIVFRYDYLSSEHFVLHVRE